MKLPRSSSAERRAREILKESAQIKLGLKIAPILDAIDAICASLRRGGKVLIFGNGGSAADSQHIAAELVGRFQKERRPFHAIALTVNTSVLTSISNDYGYAFSFERQIEALGRRGDVAIGISTSGSALNVLKAVARAKAMGLKTIGLTGEKGRPLIELVDIPIVVPSNSTPRIQESHITIGHIICELVEERLAR